MNKYELELFVNTIELISRKLQDVYCIRYYPKYHKIKIMDEASVIKKHFSDIQNDENKDTEMHDSFWWKKEIEIDEIKVIIEAYKLKEKK